MLFYVNALPIFGSIMGLMMILDVERALSWSTGPH